MSGDSLGASCRSTVKKRRTTRLHSLTLSQIGCLIAIHKGRGISCLQGYNFASAEALRRAGLIFGLTTDPYWKWRLTDEGRRRWAQIRILATGDIEEPTGKAPNRTKGGRKGAKARGQDQRTTASLTNRS